MGRRERWEGSISQGHEEIFPFHFIPSRHAMLPPKFLNDLVVPISTFSHQREANQEGQFLVWRVLQEALAGRHSQCGYQLHHFENFCLRLNDFDAWLRHRAQKTSNSSKRG